MFVQYGTPRPCDGSQVCFSLRRLLPSASVSTLSEYCTVCTVVGLAWFGLACRRFCRIRVFSPGWRFCCKENDDVHGLSMA